MISKPVEAIGVGGGLLSIVRVCADLRGSTQAKLVECHDGRLYVLKQFGSCEEPNLLANESMGWYLLQGLGFRVPRCGTIRIDLRTLLTFPRIASSSEWAMKQPNAGYHFASEYIPHFPLQKCGVLENSAEFLGIGIFDLWASNADPRQFVRTLDPFTKRCTKYYIDNGRLFGGGDWQPIRLNLPTVIGARHARWAANLGHDTIGWIKYFQTRIPHLLDDSFATIHPTWHTHDLNLLRTLLLNRLDHLPALVLESLNTRVGLQNVYSALDCSYRRGDSGTEVGPMKLF